MLTGPPAVDLSDDRPGGPGGNDAFDHVVSLRRLLNDAADGGVEQDVLVACAEALLAWDGLEVLAYAQDSDGAFVLDTAAPGASGPSSFPANIAVSIDRFVRLSTMEALACGFGADRDTCVALLDDAGFERWLLVLSGTLKRKATETLRQGPWLAAGSAARSDAPKSTSPAVDLSNLERYVDGVAGALARAASIAESRVRWAVLQPLLETRLAPEQAGEAALEELARDLGAEGATLTVTGQDGWLMLDLATAESAPAPNVPVVRDHVSASTAVLDGCTLTLAAWRASGPSFGRREQRLLDRIIAVFGGWLHESWEAALPAGDRRADTRGFVSVIDRTASRMIADAIDVTVVVMAPSRAMLKAGRIQEWVARLRSELRPSDIAGAVSAREIGVLLSGATSDHLPAVRSRLRRSLHLEELDATAGQVPFGASSRAANSESGPSLVRLARHDAVRRTMGGDDPWL